MTTDDLAELLATHFNGLAAPPIVYNAIKPADIPDVQKETADWQVFVTPYAESEEPLDRGDMLREELTCNVIVTGPIKPPIDRKKGSELSKFLRLSLRETELGGYRWDGNETVALFDADALNKNQFLGQFRATYYTFA